MWTRYNLFALLRSLLGNGFRGVVPPDQGLGAKMRLYLRKHAVGIHLRTPPRVARYLARRGKQRSPPLLNRIGGELPQPKFTAS